MNLAALEHLATQRVMTPLAATQAGLDLNAAIRNGLVLSAPTLEGRLLMLSLEGYRLIGQRTLTVPSVDGLTELAYQRRATQHFGLRTIRATRPEQDSRLERLALVRLPQGEAYLMTRVHNNGFSRGWINDVLSEWRSTLLTQRRKLLVIQPRTRTLGSLSRDWESIFTAWSLPSLQDGSGSVRSAPASPARTLNP